MSTEDEEGCFRFFMENNKELIMKKTIFFISILLLSICLACSCELPEKKNEEENEDATIKLIKEGYVGQKWVEVYCIDNFKYVVISNSAVQARNESGAFIKCGGSWE